MSFDTSDEQIRNPLEGEENLSSPDRAKVGTATGVDRAWRSLIDATWIDEADSSMPRAGLSLFRDLFDMS